MGGLGDRVPAPGTLAGSLPAAAAFWLLTAALSGPILGPAAVLAVLVAATGVGVWASQVEAVRRGDHDPGAVVVDEVAGQWLALAVPWLLIGPTSTRSGFAMVAAGFALFRLLDITKPWPVRRLERLPGGFGIVADDLAAGLVAGLLTAAAWHLLAR